MPEPFVVVDVETTGLPDKPPGWVPRLVEVGAVVVANWRPEMAVVPDDLFEVLIWQPESHLRHPSAAEAWALADLTPDEVLQRGVAEGVAAVWFAAWLGRVQALYGAGTIRAYNQRFDFAFLDPPPWHLFKYRDEGDCIMDAAWKQMGARGVLQPSPDGGTKWPSLSGAAAYYASLGHPVEAPGRPHRALHDAHVEALIALAIDREKERP
jgi:DNA polymerase III epsilon subunit-like protein